jgi:hypothetical protein
LSFGCSGFALLFFAGVPSLFCDVSRFSGRHL